MYRWRYNNSLKKLTTKTFWWALWGFAHDCTGLWILNCISVSRISRLHQNPLKLVWKRLAVSSQTLSPSWVTNSFRITLSQQALGTHSNQVHLHWWGKSLTETVILFCAVTQFDRSLINDCIPTASLISIRKWTLFSHYSFTPNRNKKRLIEITSSLE
jgi:hypothetical protein